MRPAIRRFTLGGPSAARAVLAAAAFGILTGCAATPPPPGETSAARPDPKTSSAFAVPDWVKGGSTAGKATTRAVTPDDLIGSDGYCAATRIAAAPVPEQTSESEGSNNAPVIPQVQQGPTISGGIALAMTECDVAQRAGYPGNVEIGSEAGGERSVVLTYRQGTWPGIYRFRGGRLVSIERVEVIEPPKPKKPAKPSKPSKPTKVELRRAQ